MAEQMLKKQVNCPICKYSNLIEYYGDKNYSIVDLEADVKLKISSASPDSNPLYMFVHSCPNCAYADFVKYFLDFYKYPDKDYNKIRSFLFDEKFRKKLLNEFKLSRKYSLAVQKQIDYYQAIYINENAKVGNPKKLFRLYYYLSQMQDQTIDIENPESTNISLTISELEEKLGYILDTDLKKLGDELYDDSTSVVFAQHSEKKYDNIKDHLNNTLFELNDLKVHYQNISDEKPKLVKGNFNKSFLPDYLSSNYNHSNKLLSIALNKLMTFLSNTVASIDEGERVTDLQKAFTIAHYLNEREKKFEILKETKKTIAVYERKVSQMIEAKKEEMTLQEKRFLLTKLENVKERFKRIIENDKTVIHELYTLKRKEMENLLSGRLVLSRKKKETILAESGYPAEIIACYLEGEGV